MAFKNTENQQKIIDHRNGNLLVSAGAGSGKTTVLTSHIIDRLNDKENPIDIDRLLIVTFTKAAAAEMKERISLGINDRRQRSLLTNAHISTIDSFCSWVVKNNFEKIDLDPNFKLALDGELTLIKREIFDDIMEKRYESKDPSFINFLDSYTNGKDDDNIFDILNYLYNKAVSQSDTIAYFRRLKDMSISDNIDDLYPIKIFSKRIIDETRDRLKDFEKLEMFSTGKYSEAYPLDLEVVNDIRSCSSIKELADYFIPTKGKSLFKVKQKITEPVDLSYKSTRESYNDYLKELRNTLINYYSFNAAYLETIPHLEIIFDLLEDFYISYQEEKKNRNIADFADIEHFALQILTTSPEIASNIKDSFDEILIDEYQDSNELQESIFSKISNGNNLFMVGDIKQSIYGFRNASPKLFSDRYFSYKDNGNGKAIDLSENFRCRQEVVDSVNEIFEAIMTKFMGGSDYKDASRLIRFASYSIDPSKDTYKSELVVIKSNYGRNYRTNAEADFICEKIREIINSGMPIFDKELGIERPVMYKDIAVIMRNIKTPIEVYSSKFNEYDIPAITTRSTGYFDSAEIKLLLNVLCVIDNPRQDIPLVSVMLSPIGDFTNEELTLIRLSYMPSSKAGTYNDFYDALINSEDKKVKDFLELINKYRYFSKSHNILDLINLILRDSGYEFYVKSLQGGENRLANIEMLKEYAKNYEETSYSGIYDFCKYISNIKKKNVNFDEANTLSNNENVVRIMTIHASKGLEFPIVFLSGLSSDFNFDNKSEISVNSNYGLALTCKNAQKSIKVSNFLKTVINAYNRENIISEEMRLLYVAMTRAREKLILVSSEGKESKYLNLVDKYEDGVIPSYEVKNASSMHDFIMMAKPITDFNGIKYVERIPTSEIKTIYKINYEPSFDLESFENIIEENKDKAINFNFVYHNNAATKVKGSYSISELNLKSVDATSDPVEQVRRSRVYSFMPGGAEIGSAYHAIFESITPSESLNLDNVNLVINELVKNKKVTKEVANNINPEKIIAFYSSKIGKEVIDAFKDNRLQREKVFVLGVPASELYEDCDDNELTIIQGVIDMYFEDKDGITLIDYKSNKIKAGEEDKLITKYKTQVYYYAKALEIETGKKVKRKYLYSISLNKFIEVK